VLHAGFFGSADRSGGRALGIATSAGSAGAAVFDAGGRWAGIALPGDAQGKARWLPLSPLRDRLGDLLPAPGDAAAPARIGLQVIEAP
jgi:hypothetical protein